MIAHVLLTANSINASVVLQDNSVPADKIDLTTLRLADASVTSILTTASTSYVQINSMTVTFTLTKTRKVAIRLYFPWIFTTGGAGYAYISIWQGTVGSGTQVAEGLAYSSASGDAYPGNVYREITLNAGTYTFNGGTKATASRTTNLNAASSNPATMTVDIVK